MGAWAWGIVLDGFVLLASWLLTRRRRAGWLVMAGNLLVLWSAYAIVHRQWGFFPGIVLQSGLALRGWWLWRPREL